MVKEKKVKEATQAEQADALLAVRKLTRRRLRISKARDSLLDFTCLMKPDAEDPEDSDKSQYQIIAHHKLIADTLEKVERGEILRLIITMPPRHGKSELGSKNFPAWCVGRNPFWQTIFATYNQTFAEDIGKDVKNIMLHPVYHQIFGGVNLRSDSKSASRLRTTGGGQLVFVGQGGAVTGRGADLLMIDDPLKGREEAESALEREKLWNWYTANAYTRLMTGGRIVIIMTRWHEDDLVGRLTDPKNEHYDPEEAKLWTVLTLPAIAEHEDPLGRPVGQPLWPERYGLAFLESVRRLNPRDFLSLYQQRPTAEEGNFFKREKLRTYGPEDLPKNLRYYAASDHALGTKQHNDWTVLIIIGVDEDNNIWVVDVWRDKQDSDVVVEAMLTLMKRWRPVCWWAERGHISKSIGPFLNKRMLEENVYINIEEITPVKDKKTRAQSIQARTNMLKVFFPRFAHWWGDALDELLKFRGDGSTHDDFVDALAYIGLGLDFQYAAPSGKPATPSPKVGTIAWMKWASEQQKLKAARRKGSLR
jgi:predicted phage terminase large subunit-like protein